MQWSAAVALLALLFVSAANASTAESDAEQPSFFSENVILGSGPAGIQTGFYLHQSNREYIVLERSHQSGSFFRDYPKFRKLISINKRFTSRNEHEFRLRHDWNSLLQDIPLGSQTGAEQLSHSFTFDMDASRNSDSFSPAYSRLDGELSDKAHQKHNQSPDFRALGLLRWDGTVAEGLAAPPLEMRHFSKEFYPGADDLAAYIDAFRQRFRLRVVFGAPVHLVRPLNSTEAGSLAREHGLAWRPRYEVILDRSMAVNLSTTVENVRPSTRRFVCRHLIVATGLSKGSVHPSLRGLEQHGTRYDELSGDPEQFEGRSVLIVGRGNAAFEVADNALRRARQVHVIGRESARARLAWETHYPGDVRMTHAALIETYMLKSQDGMLEAPLNASFLCKDPRSRKLTLMVGGQGSCADGEPSADLLEYDTVVLCLGWKFDDGPFQRGGLHLGMGGLVGWRRRLSLARSIRNAYGRAQPGAGGEHLDAAATDPMHALPRQQVPAPLVEGELPPGASALAAEQGEEAARGLHGDHAQVAGDIQVEAGSTVREDPALPAQTLPSKARRDDPSGSLLSPIGRKGYPPIVPSGKYPTMDGAFRSPIHPGIRFAGTLMHAADWRVASGGFVHGFRYLIRAQDRFVQEEAEHSPQAWPRMRLQGFDSILYAIKRRLLVGSGLYQMFGQLQDVVLLDLDSQLWGRSASNWDGPQRYVVQTLAALAQGDYPDAALQKTCRPELAKQLLAHLKGDLKPDVAQVGGYRTVKSGFRTRREPEPDRHRIWGPEGDPDTPEYISRMPGQLKESSGGFYMEEVPKGEVHKLARRWSHQLQACSKAVRCSAAQHKQQRGRRTAGRVSRCGASMDAGNTPSGFAVYATVSLDYGEGAKRADSKHDQTDVLSLRRAFFSDDDPTQGRFLHPVIRVFVSGRHDGQMELPHEESEGSASRGSHNQLLYGARRSQARVEGHEHSMVHDDKEDSAWMHGCVDRDRPAASASFPNPVSQAPTMVMEAHVTEDFNAQFLEMDAFGKQVARALHTGLSVLVKARAAALAGMEPDSKLAAVVRQGLGEEPRRRALQLIEGAADDVESGEGSSVVDYEHRSDLLQAPLLGIESGLAGLQTSELIHAGVLDDAADFKQLPQSTDRSAISAGVAYAAARSVAGNIRRALHRFMWSVRRHQHLQSFDLPEHMLPPHLHSPMPSTDAVLSSVAAPETLLASGDPHANSMPAAVRTLENLLGQKHKLVSGGGLAYPDDEAFDVYPASLPASIGAELHGLQVVRADSVTHGSDWDGAVLGERFADWLSCAVRQKLAAVITGGSGASMDKKENAKRLRQFALGDGGSINRPVEDLVSALWPASGIAAVVWGDMSEASSDPHALIDLVRIIAPAPVIVVDTQSRHWCRHWPFGEVPAHGSSGSSDRVTVQLLDTWQQLEPACVGGNQTALHAGERMGWIAGCDGGATHGAQGRVAATWDSIRSAINAIGRVNLHGD